MTDLESMKLGVGVVEDIEDPALLGRLKVRIFQIHSDNKAELPTKDLPWSQVLLPVNNAHHFATPDFGDWVLCTFLDGNHAQMPIVIGVIPGINPKDVGKPNEELDTKIADLQSQIDAIDKVLSPWSIDANPTTGG